MKRSAAAAPLLGVFLSLAPRTALAAPAPSPRAQLKEAVAQLQTSPDDAALREKIIALAKKVKPAPAISEEARRHYIKAVTMQKTAKTPAGLEAARAEYEQALLLAPWWADAYYNLSLADEAARKPALAIQALKLYLATKPPQAEARQAQDNIYELEAQRDLAVKEDAVRQASPQSASLEGYWKDGVRDIDDTFQAVKGSDGIIFLDVSMPEARKNNPLENQGYRSVVTKSEGRTFSVKTGYGSDASCERTSDTDFQCDYSLGGPHSFSRYHKCVSATQVGDNAYGRHLWHCE